MKSLFILLLIETSIISAFGQGSAVVTGPPPPGTPVVITSPTPVVGRFVNVSTRGFVGTGDSVMIIGFVVKDGDRLVLARAIGPTLTAFGVMTPLRRPSLEIVDAKGVTIAANAGWANLSAFQKTQISSACTIVGAFAVPADSADAAIVQMLPAGSYTLIVRGVGAEIGNVLGEIYEVPVALGISMN